MKLVEIVRGMATDDEVFDTIKALAERYLNTTTYHVDCVSEVTLQHFITTG